MPLRHAFATYVAITAALLSAGTVNWFVGGNGRDRIEGRVRDAEHRAEEAQEDALRAKAAVDRLTTDEIQARLADVDTRLERLNEQSEALQQVIDPNNAQEILTIARLKSEMSARKTYESEVDTKLESYDKRIATLEQSIINIEHSIRTLLVSVIGALVTVIITILLAILYVVRKLKPQIVIPGKPPLDIQGK